METNNIELKSIIMRCMNSSSNSNEHAKQHRPSAMQLVAVAVQIMGRHLPHHMRREMPLLPSPYYLHLKPTAQQDTEQSPLSRVSCTGILAFLDRAMTFLPQVVASPACAYQQVALPPVCSAITAGCWTAWH